MAASDALHPVLFDPYKDLQSIPEPFGTRPVPEGHVLVNHYTSEEAIPSILREGLKISKAQESYQRGTTEYPHTFATAGHPTKTVESARALVEAHFPMSSLDIGRHSDPRELEQRQGTVTTGEDIAPEKIVAVHQPWHQRFRYLQGHPDMEKNIMAGHYDDIDRDTDRAIRATKLALTAKVMLGGQLNG